jgi:hypothetical protein
MSWKPSLSCGRLYLEVKLLNAMLGRIVRFSGFICTADQNELHTLTHIVLMGAATAVGMNGNIGWEGSAYNVVQSSYDVVMLTKF